LIHGTRNLAVNIKEQKFWTDKHGNQFESHRCNLPTDKMKIKFGDDWNPAEEETIYYVWVPFLLVINAMIFLIPKNLWKWGEGGYMKAFVDDETKPSGVCQSIETDIQANDKLRMKAKVQARYFAIHMGRHEKRFWKFFLCELLNVLAVAINFNLVDWLLDGKFGLYGYEAVQYLMNKGDKENYVYNPMCHAFPTLGQCLWKGSQQMDYQAYDCLLSLNILNEKIFLIYWWWFVVLFAVSISAVFFRIISVFGFYRKYKIVSRICWDEWIYAEDPEDITIGLLGEHFGTDKNGFTLVGNWHVLKQLGDNVDEYYYTLFVQALMTELRHRRKRSEAENSEVEALLTKHPYQPNHTLVEIEMANNQVATNGTQT